MPEYRRKTEALGKSLSYVRFLYIGLHRAVVPRRGAVGAAAAARARRHVAAVGGARPPLHRHDLPGGRPPLAGEQGVHPRAVPGRLHLHLAPAQARCRGSSARSAPRPRASRRCCAGSASSTPSASIRSTAARTSSPRPTTSRSSKRRAAARVVPLPAGDDAGPLSGLVSVERDRAPHFAAVGSRFRLEGTDIGLPARRHEAARALARRQRRRAAVLMRNAPTPSPPPSCRDTDDRPRAMRELWRERPALVLWVRHFG